MHHPPATSEDHQPATMTFVTASTPTATLTPTTALTPTGTPTPTVAPTPTATATPTVPLTPAATPAATAAATACPDYDGDALCDDVDLDDDNDGCTDVAESQPASAATSGGGRNPNYFWDVMDVPVGTPPLRDKAIRIGDIGGVVARFGATREPPLSPRGRALSPDPRGRAAQHRAACADRAAARGGP